MLLLSAARPRRPSAIFFVAFLIILALVLYRYYHGDGIYTTTPWPGDLGTQPDRILHTGAHPIRQLIEDARARFAELQRGRSDTVQQAAARYRQRRGRHPPPGFGAWFAAARERDVVVIEDFFDRVHHDLNPFWGLDPLELRRRVYAHESIVRVRGGNATVTDHREHPQPWIQIWAGLVDEMLPHLPDLDMAVNTMDETRLLVPWEDIDRYVAREAASRHIAALEDVVQTHTPYDDDANAQTAASEYKHPWITQGADRYWDLAAAACPPDSPARAHASLAGQFNEPISALYPLRDRPAFVANFTESQDFCTQPHLRGMHGTFVESVSMRTSTALVPLFAGSKLTRNNEILIPGAMYLTDDPFYAGGADESPPWDRKTAQFVWRGVASGGRNRADNWWHFHRHRWVQMMNGSAVTAAEQSVDSTTGVEAPPTFRLPDEDMYGDLKALREERRLGEWVATATNVSFVNLECFPTERDGEGRQVPTCPYTTPYYDLWAGVPMGEQYGFKYLPDVDGNSFSARWRGFLRSSSCPLKATIYTEWHDDRLVPWVHFVPFDSSYQDVHAVMDYFLNHESGDEDGRRIAEDSREWAARTLRRDDMVVYVWLLLLEYARVMDPLRDRLGYVDDLETV